MEGASTCAKTSRGRMHEEGGGRRTHLALEHRPAAASPLGLDLPPPRLLRRLLLRLPAGVRPLFDDPQHDPPGAWGVQRGRRQRLPLGDRQGRHAVRRHPAAAQSAGGDKVDLVFVEQVLVL